MYCRNCGKEIDDNAVICIHCGCATGNIKKVARGNDEQSVLFNVLSFFIPLLGLILYLMWKDEYPIRARYIGKWALIGVVVAVAASIFSVVISAMVVNGFISNIRY